MKIILLSSLPLIDKQKYKVDFLNEIKDLKEISDIIIIYSKSSLKFHINELKIHLKHSLKNSSKRNVRIDDVIRESLLVSYAKKIGINIFKFNSFSDEGCINLIKKYKPDLIHNFSGDYITPKLIDLYKNKIVGSHYAKLPEIRGGDTIRWSILLDYPMYVSILFLEKRLDMGPIISTTKINIVKGDNIIDIRKKCQIASKEGHLKALKSYMNGCLSITEQKLLDGKTFFKMGRYLSDKVDEILKEGRYSHYVK